MFVPSSANAIEVGATINKALDMDTGQYVLMHKSRNAYTRLPIVNDVANDVSAPRLLAIAVP